MSWDGHVISAGRESIEVVIPDSEHLGSTIYHRIPPGPDPTVEWMEGGNICGACIGSPLFWREIPIGTITGLREFRLKQREVGGE